MNVLPRLLLLLGLAACGDDISTGQDASSDAAGIDGPGSCACTFGAVTPVGTVANGEAIELSGLAMSRSLAGTVWTHNDSGDTPRLFAMGSEGTAQGVLTITGGTAIDWEDLAIGPCGADRWCLYAADIGDNDLVRARVRVYEIDEPTASISGTQAANARTFDVSYPDGAHNSEALFVDPRDGDTYVITKQTPPNEGLPSKVFRLPKSASVAMAEGVGMLTIPTGNLLVTAADLYADACGVRLLVRTYSHVFLLSGAPDSTIATLLGATLTPVPAPIEIQGEAIAWLPDGRGYLTVSEGTNATLSRVACD